MADLIASAWERARRRRRWYAVAGVLVLAALGVSIGLLVHGGGHRAAAQAGPARAQLQRRAERLQRRALWLQLHALRRVAGPETLVIPGCRGVVRARSSTRVVPPLLVRAPRTVILAPSTRMTVVVTRGCGRLSLRRVWILPPRARAAAHH